MMDKHAEADPVIAAGLSALASSERQLPSAQQLSLRLSSLAKSYDLTLAPDATSELGEFMAVGMDGHLGDVLHNLVRMTSANRRGVDTIRVNSGNKSGKRRLSNEQSEHDYEVHANVKQEDEEYMPKPDLNALQYLVTMIPDVHPQASPALYKLQTSQLKREVKEELPPRPEDPDAESGRPALPRIGSLANGDKRTSPPKPTIGLPANHTIRRAEATRERLTRNDLLKLDRGREEGEGKKSKHNSHWRYEDPALIFKDILG